MFALNPLPKVMNAIDRRIIANPAINKTLGDPIPAKLVNDITILEQMNKAGTINTTYKAALNNFHYNGLDIIDRTHSLFLKKDGSHSLLTPGGAALAGGFVGGAIMNRM